MTSRPRKPKPTTPPSSRSIDPVAPSERSVDAVALARASLAANEPDVAELWLKLLQEKAPDSEARASLCLGAGGMLEGAGHFDRALVHLAAGLALEPLDEHTAYFLNNNTGFILGRKGRHEESERFCRAAMRVDRLRHNAQKNLGNALIGQGRWAEGSLHLINACLAAPGDPRAFHHLEDLIAEHRDELLPAWPDLDARVEELRRRIEPRRAGQQSTAAAPAESPPPSPAALRARQHAFLAQKHLEEGRAAQAVAECDLGLAWESPSYATKLWLLKVRSRALLAAPRSVEELVQCAHDTVELEPFDHASWRVYGLALAASGRHVEAARAYLNGPRLNFADDATLKLLRAHVRKFGAAIEEKIPDIRKRVSRLAAAMKRERAAREKALGQG